MEDEDQMIMDNIDEFVNDEVKIVSYKWLSLTLSLHVTKATRMLEEYLKKTDNELDVIYFVGGRKKDGLYTTFQYKLAKKNSLEDVKGTFDEVTTCHIYSIQKSCIKDADVLYANHVDVVKEYLSQLNKCSAIQCDSVKNFDETLAERRLHNHVPIANGFHDSNHIKAIEEEEWKPPPSKDVKNQPHVKKKEKQSSKKETTTKSFFGKSLSGKKAEPNVVKQGDISKPDQLTEIPDKTENKSTKEKSTDTKEKSTGKAKVEKNDISTAFAKKKKNLPKEVESAVKSETIKSDSDIENIQVDEEKDTSIKSEKNVSKSKKDISTAFAKKKKPNLPKEVESAIKSEAIKSDSETEDIQLNEGKDSPIKSEKRVTKSKKENITVSPVKEEEEVVSAPVEVEKRKKRKAPVVDSESDDDDYEKFLAKSKDPTYESPKKKPSKPKENAMAISDDDEVDVIQPTPEPVKKKKRRKTEKNESKKKKEKVEDASLSSELKTPKDNDASKQVDQDKMVVETNSTGGKRRGRRMVMKAKQYVDEEGFMVTRRECESESFSEESESEMSEEKMKTLTPEKKKEVEKKKIVIDLEKKTKAHLTKPKTQASLMNFFKKK